MKSTTTMQRGAANTSTSRAVPIPGRLQRFTSLAGRQVIRRFCEVLQGFEHGRLEVTWPDGTRTQHGADGESVSVTLHNYDPIRSLVLRGHNGFVESYLEGHWTTSDLRLLFEIFMHNEERISNQLLGGVLSQLGNTLLHAFRRNSVTGSRRNIAYHYDLGNDFYALWLDPTMLYSSAVFRRHNETLQQAQYNKLELITQMLDPEPGRRVLEIGCGWGGLARHLVEQCSVSVTGISLSHAQLDWARSVNHVEGCTDYQYLDYRDVNQQYDHIVSIEMFEAVGMAYWETYFDKLRRLLKPGGTAVLQVITIEESRFDEYRRNPDFIQRYIFPGGMLPTRTHLESLAAGAGLEIVTREWFGASYAETLGRWSENFERRLSAVVDMGYSDRFIRMWRYYLAYCQTGFARGCTDVGLVKLRMA